MTCGQCRKSGAAPRRPDVRLSQVVPSKYCGDHRFGLWSELQPVGYSPTKQRKTEIPPHRDDCRAEGGRDTPQSLWACQRSSRHQKLVDARHPEQAFRNS